jgi:glutathione S-transferase
MSQVCVSVGSVSAGQIPVYQEGDLALFESGAIVFHIAERHAGLLPMHARGRSRGCLPR